MIILEKAKFSSTQVNLPETLRKHVQSWINKNIPTELFDPDEDNGPDLHVTVKYGLHTDNANKLKKILKGFGPVTIWLGSITAFYNECDVLKIDVYSPDLRNLNKLICNSMEHTETYSGYAPHVTLGYLLKGTATPFLSRTDFNGIKFVSDHIWFSTVEEKKTKISLL